MNVLRFLLPLTFVSFVAATPEKSSRRQVRTMNVSRPFTIEGSNKFKGLPVDFQERFCIRDVRFVSKKLLNELKAEEKCIDEQQVHNNEDQLVVTVTQILAAKFTEQEFTSADQK